MKKSSTMHVLLQTTALVAVASLAHAQDVDTVEQPAEAEVETTDQITITGSRIRRDEFSSPAPIDVLTATQAQQQGLSDIASLLSTATAAAGSQQINAAVSNQFVSDGGVGAETISLRGLGANRTLVLLNGRRAGASGTRGSVSSFDLNSIPLSAVENVEILKDGASSVYGSDAIAGVVNIITKRADGGTVDLYASRPEESGGGEFRISGNYGKTFSRGRFGVTGDYFKQEALARGDRSYTKCGENYAFNDDGSRADVIDPRTGEFQCTDLLWGHVWIYDYAGDTNVPTTFPFLAQYDYDGSLAANIPPYPTATNPEQLSVPTGFFPVYYDQNDIDGLAAWNGISVGTAPRGIVNFDHPFQDAEHMIPEVERITLFADGEVEVTDSITAYGEALFNRRETYSNGYRQYWTYVYGEDSQGVFGGPATNPEPSAQGWTGLQWFSPTAITDHNDETVTVDYQRFVAGLNGEFDVADSPWNWDINYQYSKSDGDYEEDQIRNDSIQDYFFLNTLCADVNGGVTSVAGLPCVDVPWFDPDLLAGTVSPEVADFLFTVGTGNTEYTQSAWEGFLTGRAFELPAGPVRFAAGALYQTDEINDTPSQIALIVADGGQENAWGTSQAITRGETEQTAFYGEVDIPVLAGLPFIERLDLSLSGRSTEVDATNTRTGATDSFSGDTYRISANWQLDNQFRVRATQGTSFRAPALFELFLGGEASFPSQGNLDPCIRWGDGLEDGSVTQVVADNCAADGIADDFSGAAISATALRGGGLGQLESEESENFTAGIVWTPPWADLSMTLDYFEIEIEGEVDALTPAQILNGCYSSENFATEPLCDLFVRNPGNVTDPFRITDVTATFININSQTNRGVDLAVRYGQDTPFGLLTFDGQVSHQLESKQLLLASDEEEDTNGEVGEPKTVASFDFTLDYSDNWEFFYGVDMIEGTSNRARELRQDASPTLYGVPVTYKTDAEFTAYHAASATYRNNDWVLRAGVTNLFDEHPPALSPTVSNSAGTSLVGAGNTPTVSVYDLLGRRVFVNVTKTF